MLPTFYLPFEASFSPDAMAAEQHHRAWAAQMGLVGADPDSTDALWLRGLRPGRICAHAWPDARGDVLELMTDFMGTFYVFDEQWELPTEAPLGKQPEKVARVVENLVAILNSGFPDVVGTPHPVARGLADIMARMRTRMSPAWCARYADTMKWYFFGQLRESLVLSGQAAITTFEEFDGLRQMASGAVTMVPMIELIDGVALPEAIHGTPELCQISTSL